MTVDSRREGWFFLGAYFFLMSIFAWMFPILMRGEFGSHATECLFGFSAGVLISQVLHVFIVTEWIVGAEERERRSRIDRVAYTPTPFTPSAPIRLEIPARPSMKAAISSRLARHPYLVSACLMYAVTAPAGVIGAHEMFKEKTQQTSSQERSDEHFRIPYVIAYQPGVIKPYERRALCRLSDPIWWRFEYRQAPVAGYRLEMVPNLQAPIALLPLCTLLPGAVWVIPSRFGSF